MLYFPIFLLRKISIVTSPMQGLIQKEIVDIDGEESAQR